MPLTVILYAMPVDIGQVRFSWNALAVGANQAGNTSIVERGSTDLKTRLYRESLEHPHGRRRWGRHRSFLSSSASTITIFIVDMKTKHHRKSLEHSRTWRGTIGHAHRTMHIHVHTFASILQRRPATIAIFITHLRRHFAAVRDGRDACFWYS